MERFISLLGLLVLMALAWAFSEQRRAVSLRIIVCGLALQVLIGLLLLPTFLQAWFFGPIVRGVVWACTLGQVTTNASPDLLVFRGMAAVVTLLTDATLAGAKFVFGSLATDQQIGAVVAFQVLPVIILVSAISAMLYHVGVIQVLVRAMAWLMRRTLGTSGAETFGAALLVFLGIESMTAIRGYLANMTRSELAALMSTFMATIAGSVMVVYAGAFGAAPGDLLTASLMSAPAALLISKLLVPETENPQTAGSGRIALSVDSHNLVDAASRGTGQGLKLALNVGAMLIAFIGLVFLADRFLQFVSPWILPWSYGAAANAFGWPEVQVLTLEGLFAVVFAPFAFLLGVPWGDIPAVAQLLGTKSVLNEFLAYARLQDIRDTMSPRAVTIATYALCGFANPGSLGILIAGMTALAPERRRTIVELGIKSLVAGTFACFMTACLAGVLIHG